MKKDIIRLARPHFRSFEAYSPPIPTADDAHLHIIKLDQNECAYGCDPAVTRALADFQQYHVYADAAQSALRQKIGDYCGLGKENVIASNGSNQLIDLIARIFLEEGDEVINCPPTFELFKTAVELCQGRLISVPRRSDDFSVDIEQVLAAVSPKTKLIFLATPNNPTGNETAPKDILRLLQSGVVVVVDEAYGEFSQYSMIPYLKDYPNMIIMRTFSKWAGLAGLRAGYALADSQVIQLLQTVRMPYVMSVAAQVAVTAVLDNPSCSQKFLAQTIAERQRVYKLLKEIAVFDRIIESHTNFFLCHVKGGKAAELSAKLRQRGIIIRHYAKDDYVKEYLRITLGTPQENDLVLSFLKETAEEK